MIGWFLRAKRWAKKPPSAKTVKFVICILIICIILWAFEYIWGLPEWMQVNRIGRGYR